MADRPEPARWSDPHRSFRTALLVSAAALLIVWLLPPLAGYARRYEFVEALQFAFFAIVIPALVVVGSPWALFHLASSSPQGFDDDGNLLPPLEAIGPVDRLADHRRHHPEALRSVCFLALYLAGAIIWRTPGAVDGLVHHPWLVFVEAFVLIAFGMGLWLELAESPPLAPRLSRPGRLALAAISMWAVWILAYLVGLSHASWYQAYPHHPGSGFSLSADQQLTTGLLWFVSACAFIPVVYWNLIRWLQSEEDPDEELHHLVRQERIRGRTLHPGPPTSPS